MSAGEFVEIERDGLGEAGEIGDAEYDLLGAVVALESAEIGEDFAVFGVEELELAAAEDLEELAQGDHVAGPVEEAGLVAELGFDVDHLVAVDGVHDDGKIEACGIAAGKSGVAIGAPLHGSTNGVAVAEVDVVSHADLVAVIEDGCAGKAEEE